ncbi:MAG TPA: exopolysaccharide biosynthesis polyprenyl glycosylphosphotransferase [Edaphobacter sp.]|nr:exopolysaccharide biosynthesis polyprenyl glycosylphosphotransferase [Edaphobacter sp.]
MATHIPAVTPDLKNEPFTEISGKARAFPKIVIKLIALLLDYVCILFGTFVGLFCYKLYHGVLWPGTENLLFALTIQYWLIFVFLARAYRLYHQSHALLQIRNTAHVLRISCYCLIALAAVIYIGKLTVPRSILCVGWVATIFLLLAQKHISHWVFVRIVAAQRPQRRVLILGTNRDARRVFSSLHHSPDLGMVPVAFVDEVNDEGPQAIYSHGYVHRYHAPVIYQLLSAEFCRKMNVSEIFIAESKTSQQRVSELAALAIENDLKLSFVGLAQPIRIEQQGSMRTLDGLLIMSYSGMKLEWRLYEALKRGFDIVIAALLLLLTAPGWLFIAIWIKNTSEGPAFFRQRRIGHHGKSFDMLKFRTMYVDAPKYTASPADSNDPRITSAGKILRKMSLDELPQIINVLKGDMSLVGPRPEMPYIVEKYDHIERQRLNVPQGITGIWQLSADRRYAIHESLEYDLYYMEHRGFFLDMAILMHTAVFAMKGA